MAFTKEEFEKIKDELKGMPLKDIRQFAWICAVRALPFLPVRREESFFFWGADVQKHLLSVFRALDAAAFADARAAARAAEPAFVAARIAFAAVDAAADAAAFAVARAADAAAADDAAARAADAAARAADDAAVSRLQSIILKDLQLIKNEQFSAEPCDTSVYGAYWQNFLEALRRIDCEYWANWYEILFANDFEFDEDEVRQHLGLPKEILELGAAGVGHYMERLIQGRTIIDETRIIILGEKGAGKTCLARRLKNPKKDMTTPSESTEGVDTSAWQIDTSDWRISKKNGKRKVKAQIWDFAGHAVTHAAHRCFLSERCLYIIVYNARTERDNNLEYWLDHVRNYGADSPTLVLVNEWGDYNPPALRKNDLRRAYRFIIDFHHVNIKEAGKPLEDFRAEVTRLVQDNPSWNSQVMPAKDFHVKRRLEELFGKDAKEARDNIPRDEFNKIADECGVTPGEIDGLLGSLTALGASLWYADLAKYNAVVLNPNWITNGIYKIINWGKRKDKRRLSKNDFADIFKDELSRYPEDMQEFIFRLMQKYELAYMKDGDVIVPSLLGDMPDEYVDFEREFNAENSLLMEYRAEARLPENIVSRLIVRACDHVRNDNTDIWLKGAVLHYADGSDTVALVLEESEIRISIRVKGKEKTAFVSKIRNEINSILDGYRSKRLEPWYRIIGDPAQAATQADAPIMKSESDIVNSILAGLPIPVHAGQAILPDQTKMQYNITVALINTLHGNLSQTGSIANTTINIELRDCTIHLQGEISNLRKDLEEAGSTDAAAYLGEVYGALDEMETTIEKTTQEKEAAGKAIVKKGIFSKVRNLYKDLMDEESDLHKKTSKLRNGAKRIQDMLGYYDAVAQWIPGAPRVPGALLKFGKSKMN